MRSNTLKWILLTAALVISLIVATQLVWLNRQYKREQKDFTVNVVKSIRGLYEDFNIYDYHNLRTAIEFPDKNSFLLRFDTSINKQELIDSIASELQQSDVFTDCKIGRYDSRLHKFEYQVYLPTAASHYPTNTGNDLPVVYQNYSYLYLYFPHRDKYILNQMSWWIISCMILVLLLVAFATSLFFLYQQKSLNEVQNDFIRNVTHEFQTPLTTLSLGLDMISKPGTTENPEKLAKYTRLMQGQTTYLKQHIENLMKVLKTESVGIAVIKEKVVINDVVRKVVSQLEGMIEESNASIELHLEPLNEGILGDPNNIFVAILNIVSNGIKYSKEPALIIQTVAVGNEFSVTVKDNGIGIEKQFQKNLFKKFYRVPTGDLHAVKGLGLGLYFVKKVLDAHKGSISINSIPEIGTAFTLRFPKT